MIAMRRKWTWTLVSLVLAFPACGAVWAEELGDIDFKATGKAEAQPLFMKGVLLLHSFEYEDAAEAFQAAQKVDPDFAMAYWGEAMTHNHPLWAQQDRAAALAALGKLAPTPEARRAKIKTERERAYFHAVETLYGEGDKRDRDYRYEAAMAALAAKYPKDRDAAAFHALSILGTNHDGRDFAKHMRAAAIVEEVYEANPRHPGALHYLIHCYDDPIHASLGLRAARRYAKVAPDAAHALHMPSHIFVGLGMWDRVVSSNEESAAAADARRARKKLDVNARGFHSLWWLQYGYLQQGRVDKARALLNRMAKDVAESGSQRTRDHLAYMRAHFLIETERWDSKALDIEIDLSDLSRSVAARDLFARGMAAVKRGDLAGAKALHAVMLGNPIGVEGAAAMKCFPAGGVLGGDSPRDRSAEALTRELEALIRFAEGDRPAAERLMAQTMREEETIPFMFGPPVIVKPTHELWGEMLLAMDRPAEARAAFEQSLQRAPGRYLSLRGLADAAKRAGDAQTAAATRSRMREIRRHAAPADDPVQGD